MIALARKQMETSAIAPSYRTPLALSIEAPSIPMKGVSLEPLIAAALKAAIAAQQVAVEEGKVLIPTKLEVVGEPAADMPELMDVKPTRRLVSKRQVQMRATRKAPSPPKQRAKVQQPVEKVVVVDTKPSNEVKIEPADQVWSSNGKTVTVEWKTRVSRRRVDTVRVQRSEGYEQWFADNPPSGLGYTEIRSDNSTRYTTSAVTRKATTRIGNLDINLGYSVREHVKVPCGQHERQREERLISHAESVFSRKPMSASAKVAVLTNLLTPHPLTESKAPWSEAVSEGVTVKSPDSEVLVDYDNPARLSRIRHRSWFASVNYPRYKRLINQRMMRQSQPVVLVPAYARHVNVLAPAPSVRAMNTSLLHNMTVAALKGLRKERKQQLYYSVEVSDVSSARDELLDGDEILAQIERLSQFNEALIGRSTSTPLSDDVINQAVFDAVHYKPDLRTKAQKARAELAEQQAWEAKQTKEWIGLEIKERNKLHAQEGNELLGTLLAHREREVVRDDQIQDAYRLDAWLQSRVIRSPCRDQEHYERWLMRRAGRGYFNERTLDTVDDCQYNAWLFDNAGDDYHYQRWLALNETPRQLDELPTNTSIDNVVCMMEWRHKNKGSVDKATEKMGDQTGVVLKLNPPKTSEIIITEEIMSDSRKANDPTVDKDITSFGKVIQDVRKIIGKFNQQGGMGLYLPTYLTPV